MHHINPGQNWIKLNAMQEADHTAPFWQPTTCMHCDEPPCVKVCPVGTYKDTVDYECKDCDIGCAECFGKANNCSVCEEDTD